MTSSQPNPANNAPKSVKRVRDSNKKAVYSTQNEKLEQVWQVNGEYKVNTNHGFESTNPNSFAVSNGLGIDLTVAPETPYQTYGSSWEEIQEEEEGGGTK